MGGARRAKLTARGVEARGPGPFVVVRGALGDAGEHRQDRRRGVQGLDLQLLIHAQNDGALGRVEVEPTTSRTFSTNNGYVLLVLM
jgi:hypothetical protein